MVDHRAARPLRLRSACVYLALIGTFWLVQPLVLLLSWYGSGEESVRRFTDPLVEEGMARGDAETVYRVYLAVLAMLAGAVVVFAIHTALGHAASRILVTITAPLLALVGLLELSFLSTVLTVVLFMCTWQLWSPEARRWFALLAGDDRPAPASASVPGRATPAQPIAPQAPAPGAWQQVYAPTRPAPPQDWVRTWSIVALVVSSVVALGCSAYLVLYGVAREQLVRAQVESGSGWMDLSEAEVRDALADLATASWVGLALAMIGLTVSIVVLVRRRRRV